MNFALNDNEKAAAKKFFDECYAEEIEKQKGVISPNSPDYFLYKESWDCGYPYGGAIGGFETYCFTPTSIGDIKTAVFSSKKEKDITDYEAW